MDDGEVIYTDHVGTRNKDIPGHMEKKKMARRASRRGERIARKCLAKKHGTLSTKLVHGRKLAGCEEPVPVKDIINTESRFRNRKRHNNMADILPSMGKEKCWLTPTAKQLVETHLNHVDQVRKMLPVTGWCLELNRFAFMKMEDGTVYGVGYQNGKMKGFPSVEEYVFSLQEGKCACCGRPVDDIHHIVPRHKGGSDGPDNRIGLCRECHHKMHTGELDIKDVGIHQKYGALSILNQAIPFILSGLIERFGEENVFTCLGHETALARELYGLPKEHCMDAVCIAAACTGMEPKTGNGQHFEWKQFRRHDRARINNQRERTYYLDGKAVAKNRRPREEQKRKALTQWFGQQVKKHGPVIAREMRSRLTVKKSVRYYNNTNRLLPGAVFMYRKERHVMTGQLAKGAYYRAYGQGGRNFRVSDCRVIKRNTGIVCL